MKQIPDFLILLSQANAARNAHWDPENKLTTCFFGLEFAGEVGELCNGVKKLERDLLGLRGSRVTRNELLEEVGDVLITFSLLCNSLGISAQEVISATADKFNTTSAKIGLPVYISLTDINIVEAD